MHIHWLAEMDPFAKATVQLHLFPFHLGELSDLENDLPAFTLEPGIDIIPVLVG